MSPRASSALAVFALLTASFAARAELRIDLSTRDTQRKSMSAIKASMPIEEFARFQADWELVTKDVLCPIDVEHPNIHTTMILEKPLTSTFQGKSVAEVRKLAASVASAKEAERASLRELALDSEQARGIRTAVEQFLAEAPEGATHYMEFSRFWTKARKDMAEKLQAEGKPSLFGDKWPNQEGKPPPSFAADARGVSAVSLMPKGWMKKLKVTRILANDSKAYVDIAVGEASSQAIYLKEADGWKSHADFVGFPWSSEGTSAPECVGVLQSGR